MTAYQRIADSLRQRLLSRQWQPGQRLPAERELCEHFAASRITVRRALEILEREHLVARRQGAGTFANSTARRKIPILNTDFSGSIRRYAPRLRRHVQSFRWASITGPLALRLQACVGDRVLRAVRIDQLRGEPVALDQVFLPERFADRLTEGNLAEMDFLHRWQDVQRIRLEHCAQTIEAARAQLPVRRWLRVRAGTPLLKETGVAYLAGGQPAGLFVSYYRYDRFRFEVTFDFSQAKG